MCRAWRLRMPAELSPSIDLQHRRTPTRLAATDFDRRACHRPGRVVHRPFVRNGVARSTEPRDGCLRRGDAAASARAAQHSTMRSRKNRRAANPDAAPIEAPVEDRSGTRCGHASVRFGDRRCHKRHPRRHLDEGRIGAATAAAACRESVPVRPGGQIQPPRKLKDAAPIYPQIALSARVAKGR